MKKVSVAKKKVKGTRYVANVLKKYFKKRYPTYNSALPKAREIVAQLKLQGLKVNTRNVRGLGVQYKRLPKAKTKQAPYLFYRLLQPMPYFNLQDYPVYIKNTTNEIFFVSPLFNQEVEEIQGGTKPKYSKTFSGYVDFVNKEIADQGGRENQYETDYRVVCLPPEYNKVTKRWESQIVSINAKDEPQDYGYIPSQPLIPATGPAKKEPTTTPAQKPPQKPVAKESEKTAEIKAETEKTRQENLNLAMKLFLNKDISKSEYKEMIEMIKKQ